MHGTEPREMWIKGPRRVESLWSAWCGIGARRWRWPRIGRRNGLGGRADLFRNMARTMMVDMSHVRKRMM